MGILDDAIKEHLELKRQHGADADELKQLEDEAFGAAERPGGADAAPDPLAEAPTEFMQQPEAPEAEDVPAEPEPAEEPAARRTEIADLQELSEPPEEPAEEESPAMEHEAVPEPPAATGPTTEEREAIAEQPTEMYDVVEDGEDFFDEQRLSDELDQALDAPAEAGPAVDEEAEDEEAQPGDDAEDVLEETPDFLEESEDERLWFEQKPPKDFDFDD